ncbi:MAG: hypothetical protein K6T90_04985 [Leptolyngbyaceae cyanobacterium HOT.MB2.61]|jgi:hypothetical protein|nr:hypothetical protein [Leptolyngbyaceae cyanobacterium HOT.MB2.61]
MHRTLAMFTLTICGFVITPMAFARPLIAHQQTSAGDVEVMIHLDPDDSPYAGKPTLTWFMLMRRDGDMISPSSCNCRVVAYDSRNRAIAHHLPLSPIPIEGHQKGHEAISTMITFPKPGSYTVVLSGNSKKGDFNQFELKFPVKVRP